MATLVLPPMEGAHRVLGCFGLCFKNRRPHSASAQAKSQTPPGILPLLQRHFLWANISRSPRGRALKAACAFAR